jgi:hypothetical protein
MQLAGGAGLTQESLFLLETPERPAAGQLYRHLPA